MTIPKDQKLQSGLAQQVASLSPFSFNLSTLKVSTTKGLSDEDITGGTIDLEFTDPTTGKRTTKTAFLILINGEWFIFDAIDIHPTPTP